MIAEFPKIVFCRMSDEGKDQLDKLAAGLGLTPSGVLRLAVTEMFERRKRERAAARKAKGT
jgi:predicted transcriptional regulator